MDICIVTYGRPHKQVTLDNLPPKWQQKVNLVVQEREAHLHVGRENIGHLLVLPNHIHDIRNTRHYLVHECKWLKSDKLLMLDDDMTFAARRLDDMSKFVPMINLDYDDMFTDVEDILDHFAHAGISHREGANRKTTVYVGNTRQMRVLAYKKSILRKHQITGRTKVMEDFDVNLQLLRLGYSSRISNMWVHNQGGSNVAGGCSTFRTPEVQAEAAHELKRLHPRFVTVLQKETKTSWGGGTRTDVRVQWAKARDSADERVR